MASTPAESAKGKRFSRRNLTTHETEYGPVILERIDWRATFCRSSIEAARARAIRVLSAYGAPLDDLLAVSPHGSAVREHVMHARGEEADSLPALAAQLLEVALHFTQGRRAEAASRLGVGRNTVTRKLGPGRKRS